MRDKFRRVFEIRVVGDPVVIEEDDLRAWLNSIIVQVGLERGGEDGSWWAENIRIYKPFRCRPTGIAFRPRPDRVVDDENYLYYLVSAVQGPEALTRQEFEVKRIFTKVKIEK